MTEQQWLACEDPRAMLDYLESRRLETDSKVTAWITACREAYKVGRIAAGKGEIEFKATPRSCLTSWTMLMDDGILPFEDRCHLVREIWGNPFRPIDVEIFPGYWKLIPDKNSTEFPNKWLTPKVIAMAQLISDTQDWDLLPIFADLLTDVGCGNEDVLHHARNEERQLERKTKLIASDCEACGAKVERREDGIWCPFCYWYRHDPVEQLAGWIPARAPHVKGCWLISLITGEK